MSSPHGDPNYPSSYDSPAVVPTPRTTNQDVPPVTTRTPQGTTASNAPHRTQHSTGAQSSPGSVVDYVKTYVLSMYGLLKIVQIIACIFGIIFAGASDEDVAARGFFIFVCVFFIVLTLALYVIYALRLHHKLELVPWLLLELVFNATAVLLFLISSITLAAKCDGDGLLVVAVIVGFVTTILYGGTGFFAFLEFRSGGDPAGAD